MGLFSLQVPCTLLQTPSPPLREAQLTHPTAGYYTGLKNCQDMLLAVAIVEVAQSRAPDMDTRNSLVPTFFQTHPMPRQYVGPTNRRGLSPLPLYRDLQVHP